MKKNIGDRAKPLAKNIEEGRSRGGEEKLLVILETEGEKQKQYEKQVRGRSKRTRGSAVRKKAANNAF